MTLAISNIAWPAELEPAVADLLAAQHICAVEIAPGKVHPQPLSATAEDLRRYRDFWECRGIRIVAMQALLFGKPELQIFAEAACRRSTLDYLSGIIQFAGALGVEVLVFGSPKNRLMGSTPAVEAWNIAVEFFGQLGRVAEESGCSFCIEPNPKEYGCDFVTSAAEGLRLVRDVDQPGFGLHLDAAGMSLSDDSPETTFREAGEWLRHFHASEPYLAPLGSGGSRHEQLAASLSESGYSRHVSIEMKTLPAETCLEGIQSALDFCRAVYPSQCAASL